MTEATPASIPATAKAANQVFALETPTRRAAVWLPPSANRLLPEANCDHQRWHANAQATASQTATLSPPTFPRASQRNPEGSSLIIVQPPIEKRNRNKPR